MEIANIFSDRVWFWVLEGFIALVFMRAIISAIGVKLRKGGTGVRVTRGNITPFISFLGLSVIIVEIIISSNIISNH